MDNLKIARGAIELLVSTSVHSTVANALRNLNDPITKWQRVKVGVGSFVVASMISDAAEKYAVMRFDQQVATVEKWKKMFQGEEAKDQEGSPEQEPEIVVEEESVNQ